MTRWAGDQRTQQLNRLLQSTVLFLIVLVALPIIGENLKYFTTTLTQVIAGEDHGGDFIAFYAAGQLYAQRGGASAYDLSLLRETELAVNPALQAMPDWVGGGVNPYRNPPFYLPFLGYLARFSLPVAFTLTAVLGAVLLSGLLAITAVVVATRTIPLAAVTWVALTLAYYDVWHGLAYGQLPSYIIALGFTGGVLLLRTGPSVWAGLAFALLWLKVQYVAPLVLFLLVRKEWRVLVGLLAGTVLLWLVSLVLVGVDGLRLYAETTVRLALAPRGLYAANHESMINWRGLLERALAADYPALIVPGQFVLTLLTYGLAIWAWTVPSRGLPWRREVDSAVLTLTMILASPHVHVQDMVLLLPTIALITARFWHSSRPWLVMGAWATGLLLLFWLLPRQTLLSPGLHLSVLLLAVLFAACLVAVHVSASVRALSGQPAAEPSSSGGASAVRRPPS